MNEESITARLGKRVRSLRNERHLTQEQLADICGLHRTYIGMIERGEKRLTVETAQRLASGLGVKLWELFIGLSEESNLQGGCHD
jgi:transcriptional regulator with XRE-family HTH domain